MPRLKNDNYIVTGVKTERRRVVIRETTTSRPGPRTLCRRRSRRYLPVLLDHAPPDFDTYAQCASSSVLWLFAHADPTLGPLVFVRNLYAELTMNTRRPRGAAYRRRNICVCYVGVCGGVLTTRADLPRGGKHRSTRTANKHLPRQYDNNDNTPRVYVT